MAKRAKRQLPTLPANFLSLPVADQDAVMQVFMAIFDRTKNIAEREAMLKQLRRLDVPTIPGNYIELSASERAAVRKSFDLSREEFAALAIEDRREVLRCKRLIDQMDKQHPPKSSVGDTGDYMTWFRSLADDEQDTELDTLFAEFMRRTKGEQVATAKLDDDLAPASDAELAQLRAMWGDES